MSCLLFPPEPQTSTRFQYPVRSEGNPRAGAQPFPLEFKLGGDITGAYVAKSVWPSAWKGFRVSVNPLIIPTPKSYFLHKWEIVCLFFFSGESIFSFYQASMIPKRLDIPDL